MNELANNENQLLDKKKRYPDNPALTKQRGGQPTARRPVVRFFNDTSPVLQRTLGPTRWPAAAEVDRVRH